MDALSKEHLFKDLTWPGTRPPVSAKLESVSEGYQGKRTRAALDLVAGLVLFFGTAAVVWWQNTRLTVLYDLCGVLENAARMAQGDMPYRDFPFPYAPLTFLTQAAIIKLTGPVYWHHIVYCCVIAGLATVLTWRILIYLFRERLPNPRATAFSFSLPLTILGVYGIFPHPFYDPDTAFVVLLSIFLLFRFEAKGFPSVRTFLTGMLLVLPLFFKQNIGLAFLGSTGIAFVVMIVGGLWSKTIVRPYLLLIAGSIVGLGVASLIVQNTFGTENYKYWTLTFAMLRRTPPMAEMLAIYTGPLLALWSALFLVGAFLFRQDAGVKRWPSILAITLMSVPFVWPVIYLLFDTDASERGERLVAVWPLVLIASFLLAYIFVRRQSGIAAALPFILICTINGVFLSQQLWGSTYGIWPLLMILIGCVLVLLFPVGENRTGIGITVFAGIISVTLLVAGGFYVYSNDRLDYVNFLDGEMAHSKLPQLQGLSMRGDWLPDFDEMVDYTEKNIPPDAGILYLPGEDLFYYTTGRHPHFDVLLFDVTNNPYEPSGIRERVTASDIEWIIVKNDTEIETDSMIDSKTAIFDLLKPDFRSVDSLNNYEIYKRRRADDPPDEGDNGGDDGDDSSDTEN